MKEQDLDIVFQCAYLAEQSQAYDQTFSPATTVIKDTHEKSRQKGYEQNRKKMSEARFLYILCSSIEEATLKITSNKSFSARDMAQHSTTHADGYDYIGNDDYTVFLAPEILAAYTIGARRAFNFISFLSFLAVI